MADSDLWTARQRGSIPFFADFLQPWGTWDSLNTWVRRTDDGQPLIALAVHFSRKDCPPQAEHRHRLALLLPHLRRAFATQEKLRIALLQSQNFSEALDLVADPVMLLGDKALVLRANPAALEIVRAHGALTISAENRLVLRSTACQDELHRGLAQCGAGLMSSATGQIEPPRPIVLARSEGRPIVLTLQSLQQACSRVSGAKAVLFINAPAMAESRDLDSVRLAYGLTKTEIEIARRLFCGLSSKQIAMERQIAYETVRSHIKNILAKTGTDRQAHLIRLIQGHR